MLPKQTLPVFEMTIPSTKKKVKFRQFTVREEKQLLQAEEMDDLAVIISTVKEVILSCVSGLERDELDRLAHFDIEYIMVQLRAKSVDEVATISLKCEKDPSHTPSIANIDIEQVKVVVPEGHTKDIKLFDDVGVMMRYPTIDDIVKLENMSGIEAAAMCIDYIYTKDEIFYAAEQTPEEIQEWVNDLKKEQVDKIGDLFFSKMPVYQLEVTHTCRDCGTTQTKTIKGFSNFFG